MVLRMGSPRVWMVWLLLALLPLRGWAQAAMPGPLDGGPVAQAVAPNVNEADAVPCHAAPDEDAAAPADHAHCCTACDLCHAGALPATAIAWLPEPLAPPAPRADAGPAPDQAEPDRLDRPPRF